MFLTALIHLIALVYPNPKLNSERLSMNNDFATLAGSGMRISAALLDRLSPEAQDALNAAMQGGARLALEFGPLPAFSYVQLTLIEREGARHQVGALSLNEGPIQ